MKVTRKIQLLFDTNTEEEFHNEWKKLRDLEYQTFRAANFIINHQFFNEVLVDRIKLLDEEIANRLAPLNKKYDELQTKKYKKKKTDTDEEDDSAKLEKIEKDLSDIKKKRNEIDKEARNILKDFFIKSVQNSTYELITKEFPELPSYVHSSLNNTIYAYFKKELIEIKKGNRTLRNFKKGMPIPFMKTAMRFSENDNNYFLKLLNLNFKFNFGRDRSNNKIVIQRLLYDNYHYCDSSIQIKNNKIFLLLVVDIPNEENILDKNICIGVDLGLNIPVYLAINDGKERKALGSREEFLNYRIRLQAKRRRLQRSLVLTKGGKGRTKKLKALERYQENEKNYAKTYNHALSCQVIKFAKECNAGVIKMENLAGIGEDEKNKFVLRYWSYYQLQQDIKYKAEMANIEVRIINPYHTSQDCSFCGHWEEGQRLDQANFLCKNPDCTNKDVKGNNITINADYNAARNIAKSEKYVK